MKQGYNTDPDIAYRMPVVVHHRWDNLPGNLAVARRVNGSFWEARLFVSPSLHLAMDQIATPTNGGFGHLSDEKFLEHVRVVFGFLGGADFDFVYGDVYRKQM